MRPTTESESLLRHTWKVWGMVARQQVAASRRKLKRVASVNGATTYEYGKFSVRAETLSVMQKERW